MMTYNPISTDWFKNMALFSISRSLVGKDTTPVPNGDMFTFMLQALLNGQSANASEASPTGNIVSGNASMVNMIKDYTHLVGSNVTAALDFTDSSGAKLDSVLKGKLAGMGASFMEAGRQYNINPNLLASIAMHETGNGSSRAASEKNNIAGMMGKNGLRSYDSVADSIFDMARNLRKNYLDKGFDTIAKIGGKYAPVGAANDPTGLNNNWVKGVNNFYYSLIS
ncbi:glucosaminidase domain-containing protein [Neobacillus niacini]|uniref:glucosaminidase domain-containing protein n=1 Tax=Neobacillus niacini TaxID=86668 RepID=UPI0021CB2F3F|nr:glucosaminidase domain-containing protein [Neobacillus niacini]MCM3763598.1 glucosaminidase domain-containing protein [Neobacillus niacini]